MISDYFASGDMTAEKRFLKHISCFRFKRRQILQLLMIRRSSTTESLVTGWNCPPRVADRLTTSLALSSKSGDPSGRRGSICGVRRYILPIHVPIND